MVWIIEGVRHGVLRSIIECGIRAPVVLRVGLFFHPRCGSYSRFHSWCGSRIGVVGVDKFLVENFKIYYVIE